MTIEYNDKIREKFVQEESMRTILQSAIFLYQYYPDDPDMMFIAMPILRLFEKKGLIVVEEVEFKNDNVIDFNLFRERRKMLRATEDDE